MSLCLLVCSCFVDGVVVVFCCFVVFVSFVVSWLLCLCVLFVAVVVLQRCRRCVVVAYLFVL